MKKYLLSIYQPDEGTPPPEFLDKVMRELNILNQEMKDAGVWVFGGGLYPPHTATVLQVRDGDLHMTDGPYTEGKEHLGGFTIIEAPDLDQALGWARKLARVIVGLPIEVRPFQH